MTYYRCCEHCPQDQIHDVEPDRHEVSCARCDGAPLELLTAAEHKIIADAGHLWNDLCAIVLPGPHRESDRDELVHHIHAIQRVVMAQAAKRAYPEMYRQLGQARPGPRVD